MQQLTGVDATFLYVESPTTFGHVSSLIILDPRDGPVPGFDEIKALYQDRLHLLTPFRRRLVRVPFDLDHPYWVEDPDLDLDFHIRDTAVAPPGDDRQVAELVARLIARPLDRSRPLWELYLIHGLEGGRLGLLTKVHHAAIDGIGGAKLLASLLDLAPDADPPEPEALPDPETVPGEPAMLARGVWSLATRPYRSGRFLLKTAGELPQIGQALDVPGRLGRAASSMPQGMLRALGQGERRAEDDPDALDAASTTGGIRAPHTRFNGAIGPHRRFAFTSLPLSEVKAVKQALGVTVNDVVLGMCAGALRRYLDERGELPETSLRCAIPVSVRDPDEANTFGNKVSVMMASLATDVADPVERLRLIGEDTRHAKETFDALPADLLTDVADFAPPAITARASRVLMRTIANTTTPPFNLMVSNVPGPQFPLYLAGTEMRHYFPVSAVTDTQALNITIQSYNGSCDFGMVACRDAVPDLWDLSDLLATALDELKDAAGIS